MLRRGAVLCVVLCCLVVPSAALGSPVYEVSTEAFEEPPVSPGFFPATYGSELAQCPEGVDQSVEENPEGPEGVGWEAQLVAHQLTLLRGELQQECKVYQQRFDTQIYRQWWQLTESFKEQHAIRQDEESVSAVYTLFHDLVPLAAPGGEGIRTFIANPKSQPANVELPEGGGGEGGGGGGGGVTPVDLESQTAQLKSATYASGEAVKAALWVIAGMLVGLAGFYALWKLTVGRD
jgi:hypothetical protein